MLLVPDSMDLHALVLSLILLNLSVLSAGGGGASSCESQALEAQVLCLVEARVRVEQGRRVTASKVEKARERI